MKRPTSLTPILLSIVTQSLATPVGLSVDSIGYYDALQSSSAPRERVQNVDVFEPNSSGSPPVVMCHLAVLLPASIYQTAEGRDGTTERIPNGPDRGMFRYYTAVELAAHHFNNGMGDIVPELAGINATCPVRISTEFFDTESKSSVATMHLIDATLGREREEGEASSPLSEPTKPLPCAVLGSYPTYRSDDANHALATVSTLSGLMHLVLDESADFDDTDLFPLVGRVVPSALGSARAIVAYLRYLGVTHVGLLYDKNVFGNSFDKALQDEATKHGIVVASVPIVSGAKYTDDDGNATSELQSAISRLKRSHFRYFVGHVFDLGAVQAEAYTQGIAGPGFNWIHLTGRVTNSKTGTPKDRGTQGLSFLFLDGARQEHRNYQALLDIYRKGQMMDHINSKWPTYPNGSQYAQYNFTIPYATKAAYEGRWPLDVKSLQLYDSVTAMGLSACHAAAANNATSTFDGKAHFDSLVASKFEGVTGFVKLTDEGSRNAETAYYVIYNVVRNENMTRESTMNYSYYFIHRTSFMEYDRTEEEVVWRASPEFEHVYADGSNVAPLSLPPVNEDKNFIGTGLRATVLAFCGVIILTSLGFAVWTYYNRNTRLVKASQPFFLLMICGGTVIMGTTLIPLSIDDNIADTRGADIACRTSPWLFSTGWCIIFSALHAKIWRINKLFHTKQFRRVVVRESDVLPPFLALFLCNMLLLTLWTVLAPLSWNRQIVAVDRFTRTLESYGQCVSEGDDLVYIILLVVINMSTLVIGNYQAYVARSIGTEFSESRYIALAMASIFQVFFIGIPLMALVVMPSAQLFVMTAIIAVICLAVLLLVFVPKIVHSQNKKAHHPKTGVTSGLSSTCSNAPGVKNWGGAAGNSGGHTDLSGLTKKYENLVSEKKAWEEERERLMGALASMERPVMLANEETKSNTDHSPPAEQTYSEPSSPSISHAVTVQLENEDSSDLRN